MQKIFITGAKGFIGSHLSLFFSGRKDEVTPIFNAEGLIVALKEKKPDYFIHCAGSASVYQSWMNPQKDFNDNVVLTESVFSAIQQSSPQTKVIFISSAAVYGDQDIYPITEAATLQPISPYGFHKQMCEMVVEKYYKLFGMPATILRGFSIYGPGLRKQIFWDLVLKSKQNIASILLEGTGKEVRDFVYISDFIKAVEKVMELSSFDANIINVATGVGTTIKDAVNLFLKKAKVDKDISFNGMQRKGDPKRLLGSTERLQELQIKETVSLYDGLQWYIDWAYG